jgi:hypothetical protein
VRSPCVATDRPLRRGVMEEESVIVGWKSGLGSVHAAGKRSDERAGMEGEKPRGFEGAREREKEDLLERN